jgi:hypothetical protein
MHAFLLQSHIGNGVSFLNKTLSAKLFSPAANAEGSQLMLDFLREFKHNGEKLLLRWARDPAAQESFCDTRLCLL